MWGVAVLLVGVAAYLYFIHRDKQPLTENPTSTIAEATDTVEPLPPDQSALIPTLGLDKYSQVEYQYGVRRTALVETIFPTRPRAEVVSYTVVSGDSLFAIAQNFGLKPESVLWANYDVLKDNPHAITPGMVLKIPPVDGVLYQWQDGDTLESVASKFDATPDDILYWSGNKVDLANPEFKSGQLVMIPGGHREIQQWIIPTIPRGRAGVSAGVYGSGACSGPFEGAYGSGAFIWPASNHYLSGNDYWSGHLAIDIGAALGEAILAADNGVVVFAGWANGGYGYTVMIDHGNGYQTLYAHMSQVSVGCGQSVYQGQMVGRAGSTGFSTGPHLHFEIRYQGGFVNPWYVLPAP